MSEPPHGLIFGLSLLLGGIAVLVYSVAFTNHAGIILGIIVVVSGLLASGGALWLRDQKSQNDTNKPGRRFS